MFLLELSASAAEGTAKQQGLAPTNKNVFLVEALAIDSLGVCHNSQMCCYLLLSKVYLMQHYTPEV